MRDGEPSQQGKATKGGATNIAKQQQNASLCAFQMCRLESGWRPGHTNTVSQCGGKATLSNYLHSARRINGSTKNVQFGEIK